MKIPQIVIINGGRFEVAECISCGVVFTVPAVLIEQHRDHGGFHCCPNGHSQGWSKEDSEDARIRRERDLLKQQMAQRDDELRWANACRETAEKIAAAERKKVASLKKRAAAGLCPCCGRTFSELSRHIATKHPTFRAEELSHENIVSIVKAKAS